jgi:hypothetical protein
MLLILFEVCVYVYYWSFISSWNHTTIFKEVQLVTVFIEDAQHLHKLKQLITNMPEDGPSAEMCSAIHTKFVVSGGKYTCNNSNPLVFQTPTVRIPRFSNSDQK